jgi:hypothetical protein
MCPCALDWAFQVQKSSEKKKGVTRTGDEWTGRQNNNRGEQATLSAAGG